MEIVYGLGAVLAILVGVPFVFYTIAVLMPSNGTSSVGGRNSLTWTMAGATAIALVISWYNLGTVLTITLLCFAGFIWLKWKGVDGAKFVGFAGILLIVVWWLGPTNVTTSGQRLGATLTGVDTPLTTEQQTRRIERAVQEAQVEAVRSGLPRDVIVPLCGQDDNTQVWSEAISLPVRRFVRPAWGRDVLRIQILTVDGWTLQAQGDQRGAISAVRYCTTQSSHAEIGRMPLTWSTF